MLGKAETNGSQSLPPHVQSLLASVGSPALINAAERVPVELWLMSEGELEAFAKPSKVAHDLRSAFWRSVETSIAGRNKKIQLTDLARTARCSYTHAYQIITSHPEVLVWILRPVNELNIEAKSLLTDIFEQMREILDLPLTDSRGKVILQNAKLKLTVWKLLDERYREWFISQQKALSTDSTS